MSGGAAGSAGGAGSGAGSAGDPDEGAHPRDRLPRSLSLVDATLLIVASVVGSGIFFTPAHVAALLPSAGLYLAVWVAGALISLVGAFINAELGAMYPRAGGNYVYLREGIHPAAGFLAGWLSFFAIYAGTIAALAVVAVELVAPALGLERRGILIGAAGLVAAVSILNRVSTRLGAAFNNLTSLVKVGAIAAFVLLGPVLGAGSFEPWRGAAPAGGGGSWLAEVPWLAEGSWVARAPGSRSGRRSRPCSSAISAGMPASSSRARSAIRGATSRVRSSSGSGSVRRSISRSTPSISTRSRPPRSPLRPIRARPPPGRSSARPAAGSSPASSWSRSSAR
ncbi:MAG: amino acid permease [Deltaproteobacteria bacterium]|nr:amino acid permease [Deltaproteobacteria bacterium]